MGQKSDKQTPTTHSANLILKDPNSNQAWTIPAPVPASSSSSTDNVKPSTFVVVPHASQPDTLTVLDNRTSKIYQIPIEDGTIKATEFQKIVARDEGIRVFDPSYLNTAVARSKITEIDGEKGILRYRGYPIEELAEKSTFLEVAYLLIYGELPTKSEFAHFEHEVLHHTFVHSKFTELMKSFNYDSHPMGMFISAIAAMSTFHPEANPSLQGSYIYQKSSRLRNKQIFRLLGKSITVAAMAYRHRIGRQYNDPPNGMGYTEMFLYMMDRLSENEYKPNPKLARALDILFILHADHELNCSTAAMRHIGSSLVDPYSAVAGAAAALYGPLHGGANEAVVRMLESIKHPSNVPQFIEDVKNKKAMLMGFGHRVYKNYDPRAKIIRKVAYEVFEIVGREPLIEVAVELEKAALNDQYFIERKLYPNVDFYSGLIYKAMGFPLDFFPVLFAIPRIAGWLAHWVEHLSEDKLQIWRPRQIYTGEGKRSYLPMEYREENRKEKQDDGKKGELPTVIDKHPFYKRSAFATFDGKNSAPVGSGGKSKL